MGETSDEDDYCLHHFGCRPLDYLEQVGWLNERVWLAHGIHFNDAEMARLGKHGMGICHCPTSNMILSSGICRTKELEAAGVTVGLGVDGSASNDSSNLMETVRHAFLLGRLAYDASAVTHLDALRWATEGSAKCLGRQDIGRIAVGCQADLACFTLDELRFSGAGDPIAALVLCGAHRADRVMIAGQWRVTDGMPVGIDLAQLRHEHGEAAAAFLKSELRSAAKSLRIGSLRYATAQFSGLFAQSLIISSESRPKTRRAGRFRAQSIGLTGNLRQPYS